MNPVRWFLIVAVLGHLTACASSRMPPRLTAEQSQRLSELPLPYSVGVETYKFPVYSTKLTAALDAAGVFARVAPLDEYSQPPDLVATVEQSIHGSAVIPAGTFLSGGVVPTVVDEDHGFAFALAPASRRTQKTFVNAYYNGKTTLGWAALAVNVSPEYTVSDPQESERFRQMLAYRTLAALRPE